MRRIAAMPKRTLIATTLLLAFLVGWQLGPARRRKRS